LTESPSEIGLRDYLEVLQRRKWIVIEVFIVLVGTVALGSFLQTPIYRATVALLVETEAPAFGRYSELPLVATALQVSRIQSVETHKRLITRRPLLTAVIEALGLEASAKKLEKQISVETFRDTDVFEIHVDDKDPVLAADIANSVADNYVLFNQEYRRESAKSAASFLEEQLAAVKEDLVQAEEEVEQYKRATGISDLDEETRQQIDVLGKLEGEQASAEANAQAASAQDRVIEEKLSEQEQFQLRASTEAPNPVIQDLETELARLETQRAGLLEEYVAESSQVRTVDAQIDKLKQQLSQQLETVLAASTRAANPVRDELLADAARNRAAAVAAHKRAEALSEAVRRAQARLGDIPATEKELARLLRAKNVADRVYTLLLEKYQDVRVAEAMSLSNVRLVEPAAIPESPIKPRKKLNIALACIFGLILGIMLASLIEYLDDTIKDPKEIDELLEIPVLGVIPHFRKEEQILLTEAAPKSRVAEAFRTTRSNLSFVSVDQPARALLVTSASAGEGKTFMATNLAITIARGGKEVILVDTDLRRPGLHKVFDIDNTEGVSSVLVGARDLDGVLKSTDIEGLRIVPSGPLPPNPVELLASDRMAQLCELLVSRADFVLYDSPPAIMVSDAATLASRLDGVILVVEQGGPSRKLVTDCRDLLIRAHGRIVGAVLNKMSREAGRYYYYYYHYYPSDD